MTIQRMPSGRWRARVWSNGRDQSVSKVLGLPVDSFATKREARAAYEKARALLRGRGGQLVTVADFWWRWTTDPLFARPKQSTNVHNRERTRAFVARFGKLPLHRVDDQIVGEWLAGGQRNATVPALRAMFNDAMSAKGGRLVDRNPFARLGLSQSKGNRYVDPPSEAVVWDLIRSGYRLAGPSFGAWLQVAAFTGMRPGELDALRWSNVDLEGGVIRVVEQWSREGGFTLPKNGLRREAPLTGPAREAILGLAKVSEFVFPSLRGGHWTASSRAYHWKAVRAAVGYTGSLYLATRHWAGWYMTNRLLLPSEDVAIALGHTDGGELVRRLYGHRDKSQALDRVRSAYAAEGSNVVPLRRMK